MNKSFHLLAAMSLMAISAGSLAQDRPVSEHLKELRGFRMGTPCMNLHDTYDGLLREGFKVGTPEQGCFLRPGEYRIDRTLKNEDGKAELIEVSFAPDSTVWKVKVSMEWEGLHKLAEKPSVEQVKASLTGRFGQPYLVTQDRALLSQARDADHSVTYVWTTKVPSSGNFTSPVDSFGWNLRTHDLKGIVTMATLRWSDDASRQTLVVEQTNRWVLPFAAEAEQESGRQEAGRRARADASQLGKL